MLAIGISKVFETLSVCVMRRSRFISFPTVALCAVNFCSLPFSCSLLVLIVSRSLYISVLCKSHYGSIYFLFIPISILQLNDTPFLYMFPVYYLSRVVDHSQLSFMILNAQRSRSHHSTYITSFVLHCSSTVYASCIITY